MEYFFPFTFFGLFCFSISTVYPQSEGRLPYCLDNENNYVPIFNQKIKLYEELGPKIHNRHKQLLDDALNLEKDSEYGKQFFFLIILSESFKKAKFGVPTYLEKKKITPNQIVFIKVKSCKKKSTFDQKYVPIFGNTPYVVLRVNFVEWYIKRLENITSYDVLEGIKKSSFWTEKANIYDLPDAEKKEKAEKFLKEYIEKFTQHVICWDSMQEIFYDLGFVPGRMLKLHCIFLNKKFQLQISIEGGRKVETILKEENKGIKKILLKGCKNSYYKKNRTQLFLSFKSFIEGKGWNFDLNGNEKEVVHHECTEINRRKKNNKKEKENYLFNFFYLGGGLILILGLSQKGKKNVSRSQKKSKVPLKTKKKSRKKNKIPTYLLIPAF